VKNLIYKICIGVAAVSFAASFATFILSVWDVIDIDLAIKTYVTGILVALVSSMIAIATA
jgi:hypothetical protein